MNEEQEYFSGLTLAEWQEFYRAGGAHPRRLVEVLDIREDDPAWIARLDEDRLRLQLDHLQLRLEEEGGDLTKLPLYGIPFAVKDNIDVAGWPTTAACPAFSYVPEQDATVVQRLRDAGAIVVGKTNMDQFATGLVGTRSPYGIVPNSFHPEYISGGSSSGSAWVVARGIVPFALGTDTAGSGRVPAGMNNIVGLKPTRGRLSTTGVVPACRTLDCVSVFALTVEDAACVAEIAGGIDRGDPYSRFASISAPIAFSDRPRFGVPAQPEFFGDAKAAIAFAAALELIERTGAMIIPIDFGPFAALSAMLYEGPWIAERFAVVEHLWQNHPEAIEPTVRSIVEQAARFSATDVFKSEYRRAKLSRSIADVLSGMDALLVPTCPTIYTIQEVLDNPVALNAKLGLYTNFANFADLCALALPTDFREDGLPAGITLLAPAWHDHALAEFGNRLERFRGGTETGVELGATSRRFQPNRRAVCAPANQNVRVAVVGAHLRGMPLNHQLTSRGARFVEATLTANEYLLFALPRSTPPKPGLVRVAPNGTGAAIAVELWDVPSGSFGSFTAEVPSPLGIGNILLSDGRIVKGFICEPFALEGAEEITSFGGWKAYMQSLTQPS